MKLHARFERVRAEAVTPAKEPAAALSDETVSPAARNLALAHHLQRLIDRGLIADYTAAARMLGVSQPRLTHLMGLLLLAPTIQAAVLLNEMTPGDKELRALTRIPDWGTQIDQCRDRGFGAPQLLTLAPRHVPGDTEGRRDGSNGVHREATQGSVQPQSEANWKAAESAG